MTETGQIPGVTLKIDGKMAVEAKSRDMSIFSTSSFCV